MKLEHKIGIAITCTFLCLTGAVIGLKMQGQPMPEVSEQVASNGKDIDTPKGKQTNLLVPTMGGEPPPNPSTSIGGSPRASKGDKNTADGSANVKPPNKSNATKNPPDPSLDFGSNNRPAFQPPPSDPRPSLAGSRDNSENKNVPPMKVEGFNVSTSNPTTDVKPQAKEKGKNDKESDKAQSKEAPAPVGIFFPGNDGGSAGSFSPTSSGGRDNPKSGATPPLPTGTVPPAASSGQGGNGTTSSADKDKGTNGTTFNNQSDNENSLNNNSAAPFLPGSASTGGTSKPASPTPAAPAKPSIIPIGAFDGSQPPPPTPPPTLEMDPGKPAAQSNNSATGGATPTPNPSLNTAKPSKDNTSSQGNPSLTSPSKPSDPKAADGKPAPSLIPGGEKGTDDKSTGSPPPPPPSPMMDKPPDNKAAPAPAPPASPPAPANKPANDSYFIPDSRSTTGSGASSTAGSSGRSTAAPPNLLPYPEMPGSPSPSGSPSGTERVKPVATGGAATAPQTIARPQPQVIVYDEQEYRAAAGDTFETISKKYYGTEKFGEALRRHNRYHARASLQMANQGTLAPGERLYIPPADILEQRYGDTIVKPPSSQAVPASFNSPSGPTGK